MIVRRARPEDAPAIFALVEELARYERMAPPTPEARERLRADAFGRGRVELWVAEREGRVVAYAATFETYSTFLARPLLYLEDLFVTATARRRGVARALLAHLARETLRRGCARLAWTVLDWNRDAQAFYDGLGARRQAQWLPYALEGKELEELAAPSDGSGLDDRDAS
jgi:GNAT superfamily N-acetyltransferase